MLVYRVVELGAQAVTIVVTARLLQPEGRGFYALASLTAMLCVVPLGSVWYANAYELSRRQASPAQLMGASLVIAATGGTAIALAALAVAATLGDRWWVVAFPAATTPFLLLGRYAEGMFQTLGRIHAVGLITVARVVVPLGFISAALLAGADDRTAIGVWSLSFVVLAGLIHLPLRPVTRGERLPDDGALYRRLVRFAVRLSPGILGLLGASRMGLIVLVLLADPRAVGVYSVAIALGEVLTLTTQSLLASAFPRVGAGDRAAAIRVSVRAVRHAVLLALIGGVLVAPASFVAVPIIVGPGYEDVPILVALLVPAVIAQAVVWTLSTFFIVQLGQPGAFTRVSLTMTGLSLALGFPAVALLGMSGAPVAATLAAAAAAALVLLRFRREARVAIWSLRPGLRELVEYRDVALALLSRSPAGGGT